MKQINESIYQWAVIGAGPAGIAAVGKLLDFGVKPNNILWIDPKFNVGDLGTYWSNVSSNTKVKFFNDFLLSVPSFAYNKVADQFSLNTLNPNETCLLSQVVKPLQWVTDALVQKVVAERALVHSMSLSKNLWFLSTESKIFKAYNVILAPGADPSQLDHSSKPTIAFETAIDKEKLAQAINANETYAVFGSSHSAIIILRHLVELGAKKIINFYRSPCRYAIDMGDWILFDNTGLKGETATWAREYIDGALPNNLVRYNPSAANIAEFLPQCDKVIYAVGFKKRRNISIEGYEHMEYNPHIGIIGPGLFGLGIAYPELKSDPFGSIESQVGLWKFMVYLNKVMPVWLKYSTQVGIYQCQT
jgi:hypothetical protein